MKITKKRVMVVVTALMLMVWSGVARSGEIHDAAKAGDVAKVKSLLAGNSDLVNAKDNDGWTPLYLAAHHGYREIAELLLAKGADVNVSGVYGFTPLYSAAFNGNKELAEVLLTNGAYVNTKDNEGRTPLHYAAALGGSEAVVELLLSKGADVNAKAESGSTPLDKAVSSEYNDLAEILRAYGGKAEFPLHDAACAGDAATVDSLLAENPGLVNTTDNDGDTPLCCAVLGRSETVVKLLLSKGADVNAKNNDGLTPLDAAVVFETLFGKNDVAEILRAHGVK